MSLPSGYKRLEYIKYSGTQYIDMGCKATQNTKIEAKFHNEQSANSAVFGADKAWTQDSFGIWINDKIAVPVVGTVSGTIGISYSSAYDTFTLDKNTLKLNGGTIWTASGVSAFQTPTNVCLGAVNRSGDVSEKFVGKMYYCKVWENGTLIRDFIPCQNRAGNVGMWDDVNSVFYGNAGTGTFTAGPVLNPVAPTDLTASVDDGLISISWSPSSMADGYKISRDGVLIATQTGLTYTETVTKGQTYTYSVVAYNDYGDSDPATLSVNVPLVPPSTPSNFSASVSGLSATLSWDAPAKATGYRLYRDGVLLSDQTDTGYTDSIEPFVSYVYTLIAYNDDGDSPAATLTVTVVLPPSAPAELRITARTRTTIALAWDASSGASGYRLYRNGVQIYNGTAVSYIDTGLSAETPYAYAVEAFNSGGTSTRVTLEATTTGLVLITDRTQQDVDRIRELAKKLNVGTATVEELAEWNSIALKGSYDHTDLNRVGDAVQYISEILKSCGYHCPVIPKLDWPESGSGSPADMAQYLKNVQTLRGILTLLPETPNVPADMEKLTWQEANAIEQILVDLESTIKTMLKTRVACGDAYCGGEYL